MIIKYGYPLALSLLIASPIIWLWGFPNIAGRTAITALYLLTLLFIIRKWKV